MQPGSTFRFSSEEPMAAEINLQMQMDEMQMDMTIYLVDDIIYMVIPGMGWVKEDITESEYLAQSFEDPEMDELFGDVDFLDLFYSIKIDSNTFLPAENRIAFTVTIDMMVEKIFLKQDTIIKYLEFGTFDAITVPGEVIDQAVPLDG